MPRTRPLFYALALLVALTACQTATDGGGFALTAESDAELEGLALGGARPWKVSIDWSMDTVLWAGEMFTPAVEKSTFDGRCATPSDFLMIGEGRAQASHMGRVAYAYEQCSSYLTPPPGVTWEGVMTLVAADGSSVSMTYTGGAVADFEAESYVMASDYVITGGTGRFAGASGGGPGGGVVTWVDIVQVFFGLDTMLVEIDGEIAYAPGKARGR
jgi:hypothetical protein